MALKPIQTWQLVNEDSLEVLETTNREPLDNFNVILDTKLDFPFRVSLVDSVLTIHTSEVQTFMSDESGGNVFSYRAATSPIQSQYVKFDECTLDVLGGAISGLPLVGSTSPIMSPSFFVWLGFEAKSDGKIYMNWGNPSISALGTSFPVFTNGIAIATVLLQDNGSGGTWNFNYP